MAFFCPFKANQEITIFSSIFRGLMVVLFSKGTNAMPIITREGACRHSRWLVDSSPDFSVIKAGAIKTIAVDTPIWLKVGNKSYGSVHIAERHGHWIKQHSTIQEIDVAVAELVYKKLGQTGNMFSSYNQGRIQINLSITPEAFVVLDYLDHIVPHFSVTTMYYRNGRIDGDRLGRYLGRT